MSIWQDAAVEAVLGPLHGPEVPECDCCGVDVPSADDQVIGADGLIYCVPCMDPGHAPDWCEQ